MEIKMIALDLDGTLLNSKKEVSDKTVEVLQRAAEREIYIVLATGRTVWGIQPLLKKLGCVRYAVMANGAIVKDLQTGELIEEHLLPAKQAIELYDYVKSKDIMFDFFADGVGYTEQAFYEYVKRVPVDEASRQMLIASRTPIISVRNYLSQTGDGVEKVNLLFAELELRKKIWDEMRERPNYTVTSSLAANLELNDKYATKGNGLRSLCRYLGIGMEHVMAFGDSYNDMNMLEEAGIGVAMGNASEEIKAAADVITLSNDEDGVADMVIRKLSVM